MMFEFLEDSITNILDIADDVLSGETPQKKQIAKLLADGLTVYAVSEITGVTVDLIEKIKGE